MVQKEYFSTFRKNSSKPVIMSLLQMSTELVPSADSSIMNKCENILNMSDHDFLGQDRS